MPAWRRCPTKYYEIYDRKNGLLICKGTSRECKEALGCSSMDSFYALANRSRRGKNRSYIVAIKKGGETDYPVLGPDTPSLHNVKEADDETD